MLASVAALRHARAAPAAARWRAPLTPPPPPPGRGGESGGEGGGYDATPRVDVVEVAGEGGPRGAWLAAAVLPGGGASVFALEARAAAEDQAPGLEIRAEKRLAGPWDDLEDRVVAVQWAPEPDQRTADAAGLIVGVGDGTLWRVQVALRENGLEHEVAQRLPADGIAPEISVLAADQRGNLWVAGLLQEPRFLIMKEPTEALSFPGAFTSMPTCALQIPGDRASALLGYWNGDIVRCTAPDDTRPIFPIDGPHAGDERGDDWKTSPARGSVRRLFMSADNSRVLCIFADGYLGSLDESMRKMTLVRAMLPAGVNVRDAAPCAATGTADEDLCWLVTDAGLYRTKAGTDAPSGTELAAPWRNALAVAAFKLPGEAYEAVVVLTNTELLAAVCRRPCAGRGSARTGPASVKRALGELERLAARERELQAASRDLDARLEALRKLGSLTSGAVTCSLTLVSAFQATDAAPAMPLSPCVDSLGGYHDLAQGRIGIAIELKAPLLPEDWTLTLAVDNVSELASGAGSPPPTSAYTWPLGALHASQAVSMVVPVSVYSEAPIQAHVWIVPCGQQGRAFVVAAQEFSVLDIARKLGASTASSLAMSRVQRLAALVARSSTQRGQVDFPVVLPGSGSAKTTTLRVYWTGQPLEVVYRDGDVATAARVVSPGWAVGAATNAAVVAENVQDSSKLRSAFLRGLRAQYRCIEPHAERLLQETWCRSELAERLKPLLVDCWKLYEGLRAASSTS